MAMWLSLSLTDSFIREIDFQYQNFLNVENFICITGSSGHNVFVEHSTMERDTVNNNALLLFHLSAQN